MSMHDFYSVVDLLGVSLRYDAGKLTGSFRVAVTPFFDVEFETLAAYKDHKSSMVLSAFKAGGNLDICLVTSNSGVYNQYLLVVNSEYVKPKIDKWGQVALPGKFVMSKMVDILLPGVIKAYTKKSIGVKWNDIPVSEFAKRMRGTK